MQLLPPGPLAHHPQVHPGEESDIRAAQQQQFSQCGGENLAQYSSVRTWCDMEVSEGSGHYLDMAGTGVISPLRLSCESFHTRDTLL